MMMMLGLGMTDEGLNANRHQKRTSKEFHGWC